MGWWQDWQARAKAAEDSRRASENYGTYEQRQRGEGNRPWWLSQQEWERRGDRTAARNQFKQAQSDFNTWKNDFNLQGRIDDYNAKLAALQGTYDTDKPAWNPTQWSDYQGRYQGSMDNLTALMARQQAGPTTADEEETFAQMARLYGMTPEEFRAMQTAAYGTSAEDLKARADAMAFDPNSEANVKFAEMVQSQMRASEAGIGKQLETIFADRGGLGGFAAAQDYTLQMSNDMLQQRAQFMLGQQEQALQLVNQDLQRKLAIVQSGQADAREFLNDRWNNLQNSIQNAAMMANQVLNEFTTISGENRANYETDLNSFTTFFNMQKDILLTQMGIDQATMDMYQKMYDMQIAPYLDMWATSA